MHPADVAAPLFRNLPWLQQRLTRIAGACFSVARGGLQETTSGDATVNAADAVGLRQRLRSGAFVVTAEVVPPVSCEARDLIGKIEPLRGVADAVNLTDGAGARSHMASLAAAALAVQSGVEPILQPTCRDRNRIALQSDLLAAAAMGIENLLLLRGDDPSAGDQPDAKPVFDVDASVLTQIAVGIRDRRELMSGRLRAGPIFSSAWPTARSTRRLAGRPAA